MILLRIFSKVEVLDVLGGGFKNIQLCNFFANEEEKCNEKQFHSTVNCKVS